MTFLVVAGTTETAQIDGISAAGADPELLTHTPSADLEILRYGQPVQSPVVPVSPTGCPTPAVVTRAVCECLECTPVAIDAGLAQPTAAPTKQLGTAPGRDIREPTAVPTAQERFESARAFGRSLPEEELLIGETIPGGTTTALAVLCALGERPTVSSSLATNPLPLKRSITEEALESSGLERGGAARKPLEAVECMGDPVLAVVFGVLVGATEAGTTVTLAGGTQLLAASALARHHGVEAPLSVATTSFVAEDDSAGLRELASDLAVEVEVTDPSFESRDHPALNAYVAGEAKEGVGMGGALALLERSEHSMADLRDRTVARTTQLRSSRPDP